MLKLNSIKYIGSNPLTNLSIFCINGPKEKFLSQVTNNFQETEETTKHLHESDVKEHYDIIVAGGGLVGTTLACALGKDKILSEKKVLLLESAPKFDKFHGGDYGNRVSAINHGTKRLLESISAWDLIESTRCKSVKQMNVWDACSDSLITFNHDNFTEDVACIIENDLILHSVYEQLKECINVEVKNQATIHEVGLPKHGFKKSLVSLSSNDLYSCDILIGADGFNSLVRKEMDINYYKQPYNQMGLVATLELSCKDSNSTAWQRFLPTGPVAMLPLTDNLSSLVWSTSPEHCRELVKKDPDEFVNELNEAFSKDYPKAPVINKALDFINSFVGSNAIKQLPPQVKSVKEKSRACFPLGFGHASSYVVQGAAIVGDAAHRVHPLAGQGVNLGFGDVKCLVNVLSEAAYSGAKLGNPHHLLKYEKERLLKNVPIMFGIHGLQNIYNTTFTPIVLLRSLGLQLTQNLTPLKKIFMDRAMG